MYVIENENKLDCSAGLSYLKCFNTFNNTMNIIKLFKYSLLHSVFSYSHYIHLLLLQPS